MRLTKTLLVLLFFLIITNAAAEEQITNVYQREQISLNGNWKIIVDPYDNGYYTFHMAERKDGYFIDTVPAEGERGVEHKYTDDYTLAVPGDWNTQRDDLFFYEGSIWYRKDFDFTKPGDKRTFVYFGAANYKAVVYLNGEKLGTHEGGFTPFNFEITDKIKDGSNYIVVKVDNYRQEDRVPTVMTDWWNYGGLTRDVFIFSTPETFIEDYSIQLKKNSLNEVNGWVKLNGDYNNREVTVKIPELNVSVSGRANKEGIVNVNFKKDFELWSPEDPKLYDVEVSTTDDKISDKIGFRSVKTEGESILLNGKKVYLRGISIHEVAPFRPGRAYTKEDAETLLGWAKELGCNYVRLAHYPHNEFMVRKADEMGILLWTEVPVYWAIDYENEATYQNAEQQITDMIKRDKNRASIILWSLANETPVIDSRNKFLTKIAEKVRSIDDTRLLTAALRLVYKDDILRIDDPLGEVLDVLGVNEYIGWYEGTPETPAKIKWVSDYNKPAVISEFGAGALFGNHGDKDERWTEEFQVEVYKGQINMLNKVDFVVGMSPWIIKDFLSPRRPMYGIQDWYNRKGLISENGQRKKAFFTLQEFYKEKMNQETK